MPNEGVASEDLTLPSGEVGGNVALGEVEDTSLGFGEEPLMGWDGLLVLGRYTYGEEITSHLLTVCRGGLAKLIIVGEDGVVLRIGFLVTRALTLARSVGGSSKVHQPSLLGPSIHLGRGDRNGSCHQGHGCDRKTHVCFFGGGLECLECLSVTSRNGYLR